MIIRSYQVLSGDSIHINTKGMNIIVDVGFMGTVRESVFHIIEEASSRNEKIDLIIITHTDQDHISGLKAFHYRKDLLDCIDEVWLNNPSGIGNLDVNKEVSFKQGSDVVKLLSENQVRFISNIHSNIEDVKLNNVRIEIISPKEEDILSFKNEWVDEVGPIDIAAVKSDWSLTMKELIEEEDNVTDKSKSNLVSIAFILSDEKTKVLLLGDAHPDIVANKLSEMGYSKECPLKLDCVKLSHHGSSYNLTYELLSYIDCQHFFVSSNGMYLSKKTIGMISKYNWVEQSRESFLYFNHPKNIYDALLVEEELAKYHINCYYPEEGNKYVEIEL